MRKYTFLPLIALALACGDKDAGDSGLEDLDGDGYTVDVDCDDLDATINPGADDVCDGVDNDCSGEIDDNPVDGTTYYVDGDGDGDGDVNDVGTVACEQPSGTVTTNTDCDDTNVDVNPSAREVCDDLDNDCDGEFDDEDGDLDVTTGQEFYEDGDGDGFGVDSGTTNILACDEPSGFASVADDCDDEDPAINPDTVWYYDGDEDTYGDPDVSLVQCETPNGYVLNADDCDDSSDLASPVGVEVCDGLDNDCDGNTDDADDDTDATTMTTWYLDSDTDGYGTEDTSLVQCDQPSGYVDNADDCDDDKTEVNPDAEEVGGNGIDDNCDGGGPEFMSGDYTDADADYTIEGGTDLFGYRVLLVDTDNDGTSELVVSAPDSVYVFYGPTSSYGDADAIWSGDSGGSAGETLASGDFNGDSYGDVLIGAPDSDMAYLVYGSASGHSGSVSLDNADVVFTGDSGEAFGSSVANLGDVDGDGADDLGIGAYSGGSSSEGIVYTFFSSYGALSASTSNSDATQSWYGGGSYYWLGYGPQAQNGLGDLNGDGYDDFAVATDYSNSSTGGVYAVYGSTSLSNGEMDIESDEDFEIEASSSGYTLFGDTVTRAGDLDDDGYDDFLIGAEGGDVAYVFAGSATGLSGSYDAETQASWIFTGNSSTNFGRSAVAGHLDTDDDSDLAIGATEDGSYYGGAVYLWLGPVSSGSYDASSGDYDTVIATSSTNYYTSLGSWVDMGDADGDGVDDLLVGAPGYLYSGSYTGYAYLFMGLNEAL